MLSNVMDYSQTSEKAFPNLASVMFFSSWLFQSLNTTGSQYASKRPKMTYLCSSYMQLVGKQKNIKLLSSVVPTIFVSRTLTGPSIISNVFTAVLNLVAWVISFQKRGK
jgi:hypothetical protein